MLSNDDLKNVVSKTKNKPTKTLDRKVMIPFSLNCHRLWPPIDCFLPSNDYFSRRYVSNVKKVNKIIITRLLTRTFCPSAVTSNDCADTVFQVIAL